MSDHQEFTPAQLERIKSAVNSVLISTNAPHMTGTVVKDILHNQDLMIALPAPIVSIDNSSPVSFIRLPPEIRNTIYRYCLIVGEVYPRPKHDEDDRFNCRSHFERPQTQIFQLCRQVFNEAAPIYFGENKFILSYGVWPWFHHAITIRAKNTSGMAQRHLRSLSITFDLRDGQSLPSALQTNSNHDNFEAKLFTRWYVLEKSLCRLMNLQLLEVSLENCYCAFCHRRLAIAAAGHLARGIRISSARVILRGLGSSKEASSVQETIDTLARTHGRDGWHPEYDDEDPNDKLKVAFRVVKK
ncbi:hypothetical protein M436DRAFT_44182 [Aureobasidium namibiae CBS 147.97]|uniref:Uncharacterized protein n=1 Tax=Aureobasidium namibiae CBS 147.97 TaxID=1043004 RepID=A0A074WSB3_9PEZI